MKLSQLSPMQQSQLAAAVANLLASGVSDNEDIAVLMLLISAVRDNVALYNQHLKTNCNNIVSK